MVAAVAVVSLMPPRVGPATVREATCTRMPSSRSSWSTAPAGSGKAALRETGAGSGWPDDSRRTLGEVISVRGGWRGSLDGTNSATVPVTWTRLPTAAAAGGAEKVNTKTPSEVAGSASTVASGSCTKKPFDFTPVTTPRVETELPTRGEAAPLPWIEAMAVRVTSSLTIVPVPWASATVTPTTFVTFTKKVSFASTATSPFTVTSNV